MFKQLNKRVKSKYVIRGRMMFSKFDLIFIE